MRFTVEVNCDSAAFENLETEVIRILREAASHVERGIESSQIIDSDGNTVGSWEFTD
jgi:hypothetical protein